MPALPYVGLDEIKNDVKGTIKALVAELLGTALLVRIRFEFDLISLFDKICLSVNTFR